MRRSRRDDRYGREPRHGERGAQKRLEEGAPVPVPTTYENEDGESVHADAEVLVEPRTTGFVRAFVNELPSPFECDSEVLDTLPTYQ